MATKGSKTATTKKTTAKPPARAKTSSAGAKTSKAKKALPPKAAAVVPVELRVPRRTIFIDVENTSNEAELERVLDALEIDRAKQPTEFVAVGNWRSVGQRLARRLAALGAQLVHSAPVTGVRDWSDLWIAVSAGLRLGQAAPGDRLEIVSDDRAFDAVGDAAANLGVIFQRISTRAKGRATPAPVEAPRPQAGRRRPRRGSRRAPTVAPAVAPPAGGAVVREEPQAASREQLIAAIKRLSGGDPQRWVNLDILESALKAEGFTRPPGSVRLVTRLRNLAEVEVSPHGAARLAANAATGR